MEEQMTKADYPLFIPPDPLFKKKAADWSAKEAKQYYRWVLDVIPTRIDHLLKFFGEELPKDHRDWEVFLNRLGKKYTQQLQQPMFSEHRSSKKSLTNRGTALAADIGLLGAQLLIMYPGSKVHWELLNDPGAFGHNLPILKGFAKGLYLDPVGGTIYEARAILKGTKSSEVLQKAFVFWRDKMP